MFPLSLIPMIRAVPATNYHNMASAIMTGLGGPETNSNHPTEPEPYPPSASSQPFPTVPSSSNRTNPDPSTPLIASSSNRKPNPGRDGHSASNRSRWGPYNIDTDYERVVPDTGVTREYWLDLLQVTLSPDGIPRTVLTVNGTMPGPTLTADWGDFIVIHVRNSLFESQNGTSIHWYGT